MDKRYQVFVSSTYADLQVERQEVIQALLELDCIPAGMELFPAADEDQWTLIKKVIDDCDYYIVVVGGRYGSLSAEGLSYTQMEYEYALTKGKPIIGFLHKDPGAIPTSKSEQTDEGKLKLKAFRALMEKKMCKYWNTSSELGSVVSRSVVKLIKAHPAVGWVRADQVPDEASSQEILRLRKQIEVLDATLAKTRLEAPKGIEHLAQGEEEFEIHFSYELRYANNLELLLRERSIYRSVLQVSWKEIFATLAPHMIDEAAETTLERAMNQFIASSEQSKLQTEQHGDARVTSFQIDEDDFQTIKIQLRALGLVAKSDRPRSVKDAATYWSLTPYGDNVMTQVRAIRRHANGTDPASNN